MQVSLTDTISATGIPGVFVAVLVLAAIVVLLPAWMLLAHSGVVTGDASAARDPNRVPVLYGYTVCLVCIIVALVSASSLFNAALRLQSPLVTEWHNPYEPSLLSFEAYRATARRADAMRDREAPSSVMDSVPESELRARYEALRSDRVTTAVAQANRSLASSIAMLLLAMGLFILHWRWVRMRAHQTVLSDAPPA